MKGRYSGSRMTIYGYKIPGAIGIARNAQQTNKLTNKARQRLKVVDWHNSHGKNVSLTARHFCLTRETVIRWRNKVKSEGPMGLNDKSHRPHNIRKPTTLVEIEIEVVKLRKQYPAWSKYKLRVILKRKGINISASTVGRILKRKGLISIKVSQKRKKSALYPKRRFPHGLRISQPGQMVQIDVKYIMLPGGKKYYQFTAIDVLGKHRILDAYANLSSRSASLFLEKCIREFPFRIQAVQTDNGSEFLKYFERLCKQKKIDHYFTHARTPKENTYVETSHSADEREFYDQGNVCFQLLQMKKRLAHWQDVWNKIRPHQSLNYLTPEEYMNKYYQGRIPTKDTVVLQT